MPTDRNFAYGSNLDWEQMTERCPSASFVGVARLASYRLAFTRWSQKRGCGVADIIPSGDCEVWGVLYEVSDDDMRALDRFEGYLPDEGKVGYRRVNVKVEPAGASDCRTCAITYEVASKGEHFDPSNDYLNHIIAGARHWGLPNDYIQSLSSHLRRERRGH